jgi:CBS domain-containing protein
MQAQDVMTSNVVSVPPDMPVAEIAKLLLARRISAVPVVEADGQVVGIVSEGDLIRQLHGEDERRSWWLKLVASPADRAEAYVRTHGRVARDVMTSSVVTIEESTSITEIVRLLEARRIKRVPVVRARRLVGIVSRGDLLRGLVSQPSQAQPAPDDGELHRRVLATLDRAGLDWHPYINVVVTGSTVHLSGVVGSREEAEATRLAAEHVPGVAAVENHISVRGTIID